MGRQVGDDASIPGKPKRYGQVGVVVFARNQVGDLFQVEFESLQPALHLVMGEAEAAVGVFLAQELQLMRRKIDDQQATAWRQHPRRLADRRPRLLREMQDMVQDRGIRLARILRGVEEVRTLDGKMLRALAFLSNKEQVLLKLAFQALKRAIAAREDERVDENESDDRARSVIASFASLSGQSRHRRVASHRVPSSHRPSHPSIHPSIPRGRGRAAPLAHRFSRELGELLERGGGFGGHDSRAFVRSFVRSSFVVRSFVRRWTARRTLGTDDRHHRARSPARAGRDGAARAVARTVETARASDWRGGERDETRGSEMRGEMRGSVRGARRRAITRRGRRR